MAKKTAESTNSGKAVVRDPQTGAVTELNLPFPDPANADEVGKNYFAEHETYPHNEVIVCSDNTIFPGTAKGKNGADNYCATKGLSQVVVSRF